MGKYTKKTQVAKHKKTSNAGIPKHDTKRKKVKVKARKQIAKKKRLAKAGEARAATRAEKAEDVESGDASMKVSAVDAPSRQAGEKLVNFLGRVKTENKATDAVKKILRASHTPESLGVALGHIAGRGLTGCARLLIQAGALLNIQVMSMCCQ
eukprot:TRINITY_DN26131_c0_g1_i4.p2 TRINITY_DN26131_c0_g1~~TRINITY_DN26131_c0_g1_i4.p2  ORF type:complete len:153 (+),score=34.33 TRINITY_DN26131_c0_g1_i4:34-492(+)